MKNIAVMTSGGDSPGMNAAIRSVVKTCFYHNLNIYGIKSGYEGMIKDDIFEMSLEHIRGMLNRGGTILLTARSERFRTTEGRAIAGKNLKKRGIEGLVVIGGDGSFHGAHELSKEHDIAVIGVPATIDNDITGTDFSIGFDTAVNTALECIDRIRDTAYSHSRLFFVEVMGRDAGFLALESGIAGGADDVLIPETYTDISDLCNRIKEGKKRGKTSAIVVVAEGDVEGGAFEIAKKVGKKTGYESRVSIIGHLQRGGSPTALDRILAMRLGEAAVRELVMGHTDKMVGMISGKVEVFNLDYSWTYKKQIDNSLIDLLKVLSS